MAQHSRDSRKAKLPPTTFTAITTTAPLPTLQSKPDLPPTAGVRVYVREITTTTDGTISTSPTTGGTGSITMTTEYSTKWESRREFRARERPGVPAALSLITIATGCSILWSRTTWILIFPRLHVRANGF